MLLTAEDAKKQALYNGFVIARDSLIDEIRSAVLKGKLSVLVQVDKEASSGVCRALELIQKKGYKVERTSDLYIEISWY